MAKTKFPNLIHVTREKENDGTTYRREVKPAVPYSANPCDLCTPERQWVNSVAEAQARVPKGQFSPPDRRIFVGVTDTCAAHSDDPVYRTEGKP